MLVDLFDRGLREPLPLACLTSAAFAAGRRRGRGEWVSDRFDKEDKEPEHQFAFGGVRSYADLRAELPRDDERWDPVEPSRFGQYALRLWSGLLGTRGGDRAVSRAFDVCGPLPTGVTVLEASAGTGKTYTIAALAARYVAEGDAAATGCCS